MYLTDKLPQAVTDCKLGTIPFLINNISNNNTHWQYVCGLISQYSM